MSNRQPEPQEEYCYSPRLMLKRRDLTPTQSKVIDLLLQGKTKEEAAKIAEINPSTIWRWLTKGSVFEEVYTLAKADIWASAQWRLKKLAGKALDVMADLLSSEDERIRLRAAESILKLSPTVQSPPILVDTDDAASKQTRQDMDRREKERYYKKEHYRTMESDFPRLTKSGKFKTDRSVYYRNEAAYKKLANGEQ